MEFGTREILIVLGIIVIFGILLHGYWRVRRFHSGSLKVGRRKQTIFDDEGIDDLPGELPTGEVRVTRRDEDSVEEVSDTIKRYRERNADKQTSAYRQRNESDVNVVVFQSSQAAEEVQSEPEPEYAREEPPQAFDAPQQQPDPTQVQEEVLDEAPEQQDQQEPSVALSEFDIDDEAEAQDTVVEAPADIPDDLDDGRKEPFFAMRDEDEENSGDPESFRPEPEDDDSGRRRPFWEDKERNQSAAGQKPRPNRTQSQSQNDVIILHVMARQDVPFKGDELLEALLANNLRFGSMQIFHRHEQPDGAGPVLFSLANSLNPGTFDLAHMEDFATPGVTLLMPLEGLVNPLEAYKELIKAAQNLSKALGGTVQDDTRSALTKQTIEHYRQQIIEFTRRSFTLTN